MTLTPCLTPVGQRYIYYDKLKVGKILGGNSALIIVANYRRDVFGCTVASLGVF